MTPAKTRGFTVEFRTEPIETEISRPFFGHAAQTLFQDRTIAGPVITLDESLNVIEVRASVDTDYSPNAVLRVADAVNRALKAAHIPATPGRIEVWPDLEGVDWPDELVNGGEVARRLQISRERLRQLVNEKPPRIPRPVAETERDRIWRWGDIAEWAAVNQRRVKVPRRRRAKTAAARIAETLDLGLARARPRKRTA